MDKLLDCFQHSAVRKNALTNKILWDLGNIFLDYGKYISLHGLPGHRLFLYLRFCQIILYKNYIDLLFINSVLACHSHHILTKAEGWGYLTF